MNKRRANLIISLCNRLCEVLDEGLVVFWVQRPKLWPCFSEEEQRYFATVKKTEKEVAREELVLCDELLGVLIQGKINHSGGIQGTFEALSTQ